MSSFILRCLYQVTSSIADTNLYLLSYQQVYSRYTYSSNNICLYFPEFRWVNPQRPVKVAAQVSILLCSFPDAALLHSNLEFSHPQIGLSPYGSWVRLLHTLPPSMAPTRTSRRECMSTSQKNSNNFKSVCGQSQFMFFLSLVYFSLMLCARPYLCNCVLILVHTSCFLHSQFDLFYMQMKHFNESKVP